MCSTQQYHLTPTQPHLNQMRTPRAPDSHLVSLTPLQRPPPPPAQPPPRPPSPPPPSALSSSAAVSPSASQAPPACHKLGQSWGGRQMAEQEQIWPELGRSRERSSLLSLPIDFPGLVCSPLSSLSFLYPRPPISLPVRQFPFPLPPMLARVTLPEASRSDQGGDFPAQATTWDASETPMDAFLSSQRRRRRLALFEATPRLGTHKYENAIVVNPRHVLSWAMERARMEPEAPIQRDVIRWTWWPYCMFPPVNPGELSRMCCSSSEVQTLQLREKIMKGIMLFIEMCFIGHPQ